MTGSRKAACGVIFLIEFVLLQAPFNTVTNLIEKENFTLQLRVRIRCLQ
jgi:hypothetical protein